MRKNQSGFGIVEGVILFLVVAIIGSISWLLWSAKHNAAAKKSATPAVSQSSSVSEKKQAGAPTTKTYSSTEYGFSFEYPSEWDLSEDLKDLGRGGREGTITVTSPKGTQVHFNPNFGGKGGDCIDPAINDYSTKTCSTLKVISAEKITADSAGKDVYFYRMALTAPDNSGAKTQHYITIMNNSYIPTVPDSKLGAFIYPYDEIYISGTTNLTVYVEGKDDALNNSTKFFDSNEVEEATPVLKSFRFL